MKTTERTVHFYELRMQSTSAAVPNPSCARLSEVLAACRQMVPALPYEISKGRAIAITLADWRIDPATGNHELLINTADITKSDVAFRDMQTSNVRMAGKQRTEAVACSSHFIIQPAADGSSAKVLMTMGSGLSVVHLERLVARLAKAAGRQAAMAALFKFPVPSGERDAKGVPVTYSVRYSFGCTGYKGTILENALRTGAFLEMELVAHDTKVFDAGGNLTIEQQSIKVRPARARPFTAAGLKQMIRGYMAGSPHDPYHQARIRYKTPVGKTATTTLEMTALDAAFTHNETIELNPPADDYQTSLHAGILAEMKKLL